MTKSEYEEYLNEIGIPEDDKKSNGGRIPDHVPYGTWLRRNDPIAFQVGYNEPMMVENRFTIKKREDGETTTY